MSINSINFEHLSPETLCTNSSYESVFNHVRNVVIANGGTLRKEDAAAGTIEGAWKYGINAFGLRVTIQFRTVADQQIELHVKGAFVDAFDTTGAGKKKAKEIISLIEGKPPSAILMPPKLGENQTLNRGKTKTVAGIMALLLGGIGAHKFYLGNWGLGIVYLASVLFIPYISAIIGLIEAIRYFTLSELDFNDKYNYRDLKPFEVVW